MPGTRWTRSAEPFWRKWIMPASSEVLSSHKIYLLTSMQSISSQSLLCRWRRVLHRRIWYVTHCRARNRLCVNMRTKTSSPLTSQVLCLGTCTVRWEVSRSQLHTLGISRVNATIKGITSLVALFLAHRTQASRSHPQLVHSSDSLSLAGWRILLVASGCVCCKICIYL